MPPIVRIGSGVWTGASDETFSLELEQVAVRARVLLRARRDPRVSGASHRCSALSLTALWHRLGAARLDRACEP